MQIWLLVIGIVAGSAVTWLILKYKFSAEIGRMEERNGLLDSSVKKLEKELTDERGTINRLNSSLASSRTENDNLKARLLEQKTEIEQMNKQLTTEFENLSNRIMEKHSEKFTEQNMTSLHNLLDPLNEKLNDFKKKVEDTYDKESKDRISLFHEIKNLSQLNEKMSKDAQNLTNALKGESKTQGNWGEFILESILEKSGLVQDREFRIQANFTKEDGGRAQPDVVIDLPGKRNIIIDSKVSLTAYERYCSAEDLEEKEQALNDHINSIRKHIKELNIAEYQHLYNLNSVDFVLMFCPIESALSSAITQERGLFEEAFEKNIVIVTPSTLLATLRTVAHIWKQEKQSSNAREIAEKAGGLYDKFVLFINNLKEIGSHIHAADHSYDEAMKQLSEGKGNIVGRIEYLKELGVKVKKSLPPELLNQDENPQNTI